MAGRETQKAREALDLVNADKPGMRASSRPWLRGMVAKFAMDSIALAAERDVLAARVTELEEALHVYANQPDKTQHDGRVARAALAGSSPDSTEGEKT